MGVLYYLRRADTGELFALNKCRGYAAPALWNDFADDAPCALPSGAPDEVVPAIAERYFPAARADAWALRIAQRLLAWAGDAPLELTSDHQDDFTSDGGRLITGASGDQHYEDDSVTYKTGSAW